MFPGSDNTKHKAAKSVRFTDAAKQRVYESEPEPDKTAVTIRQTVGRTGRFTPNQEVC